MSVLLFLRNARPIAVLGRELDIDGSEVAFSPPPTLHSPYRLYFYDASKPPSADTQRFLLYASTLKRWISHQEKEMEGRLRRQKCFGVECRCLFPLQDSTTGTCWPIFGYGRTNGKDAVAREVDYSTRHSSDGGMISNRTGERRTKHKWRHTIRALGFSLHLFFFPLSPAFSSRHSGPLVADARSWRRSGEQSDMETRTGIFSVSPVYRFLQLRWLSSLPRAKAFHGQRTIVQPLG